MTTNQWHGQSKMAWIKVPNRTGNYPETDKMCTMSWDRSKYNIKNEITKSGGLLPSCWRQRLLLGCYRVVCIKGLVNVLKRWNGKLRLNIRKNMIWQEDPLKCKLISQGGRRDASFLGAVESYIRQNNRNSIKVNNGALAGRWTA